MPVYASNETMRDLECVFPFAFNKSNPVPHSTLAKAPSGHSNKMQAVDPKSNKVSNAIFLFILVV